METETKKKSVSCVLWASVAYIVISIITAMFSKIRNNPNIVRNPIIIIDGENWHQGVIGIIAAKIKGLFGKACIIISKEGENAKASGRSIEGFALNDAIFACSEYLDHFGGHDMAVGFSLKTENIAFGYGGSGIFTGGLLVDGNGR